MQNKIRVISELRQIGDKVTMSEPRGQARLAGEAQAFDMDALEAGATLSGSPTHMEVGGANFLTRMLSTFGSTSNDAPDRSGTLSPSKTFFAIRFTPIFRHAFNFMPLLRALMVR